MIKNEIIPAGRYKKIPESLPKGKVLRKDAMPTIKKTMDKTSIVLKIIFCSMFYILYPILPNYNFYRYPKSLNALPNLVTVSRAVFFVSSISIAPPCAI